MPQRPLNRVPVGDWNFYSARNAVKVGADPQGSFRNVLIRRCRIGGLALPQASLLRQFKRESRCGIRNLNTP